MTFPFSYDALSGSLRAARTLEMVIYSGFFFGVGLLLFNHDRKKWALIWQIIGLAAAGLNMLGSLFSGLWIGAIVAGLVVAVEGWLMKGCWSSEWRGLRCGK